MDDINSLNGIECDLVSSHYNDETSTFEQFSIQITNVRSETIYLEAISFAAFDDTKEVFFASSIDMLKLALTPRESRTLSFSNDNNTASLKGYLPTEKYGEIFIMHMIHFSTTNEKNLSADGVFNYKLKGVVASPLLSKDIDFTEQDFDQLTDTN